MVSGYPARYKMAARQGSTFRRILTWTVAGDPQDLTGWAARMQVRPTIESSTVLLTATTAGGVNSYITLNNAGEIVIVIPATVTAALAPGRFVYDLELVDGSEVTALLEGSFVVTPEVTR